MAKTGWLSGLARMFGGAKRTQPARRRLILERLEERLAPAAVVVTGVAGANALVVNAAGPDSGSYSLNGGAAVPFVSATSFTFNGGSGANSMTVNNPAGGLFAPSGGVFFNGSGGANTNSLAVQGGAAVTEVFNFSPITAAPGDVISGLGGEFSLVNGSTTATYTTTEPTTNHPNTDLYPVLVNAGTPQDVVFNVPNSVVLPSGSVTSEPQLQASGTPGQSEIRDGGGSFEPTTFTVPAHSVTLNENNDGTITTVAASGASVIPFLTINGGPGSNTFNVQATPGSVITINGGPSSNVLNFDAQGRPVGPVPGALTIDGSPAVIYNGVPTINLDNAAGVNALYGPDTVDRTRQIENVTPNLSAQEAFVDQLYLNALGRLATSKAELDGWVALFNTPGLSQAQAQAAIATGIEHSAEARDHLVQSWYATYLGRAAVGGEEQGFVNELLAGRTEEQVLSQIVASQEFYNRAQTLSSTGTADQRYVQALYLLVLNRPAGAGETTGFVAALPSLGRQGVALAFLQSAEFRTDQFEGYYDALLQRPDDPAGLNGWVFSNLDMASVRIGFESSSEFYAVAGALVGFSQIRIA